MEKQQEEIVNNIVDYLIDTSADYQNKIDEEQLKAIIKNYVVLEENGLPLKEDQYSQVINIVDKKIALLLKDKQKRQNVQEWISSVSKKATEKEVPQSSNFKEIMVFVSSYIENHIITYSSLLLSVEETAVNLSEYSQKLTESKNELREAKSSIDSLLPNLLTVLSILVSIIIAVLAVYITLFLDNHQSASVIEQFIQARFAKYILGAHVAGDLFFLMMFVVARLTNRTILIKCSDFEWRHDIEDKDKDTYTTNFHYSACADCRYKCSNIKKLKNKSAYIIYYNILMFVLYGILYYWWILDYYAKGQRWFVNTSDFWFVISFSIVLAISGILYFKHSKSEEKQKK